MNADLAAAIVAESHRTPEAALDFLLEMNATLCDVLLLYAGTPPEWEDGLAQSVLSGWLARTGDERAEKVRRHYLREIGELNVAWCAYTWESPEYYARWPTEADARRYLKRRVLGLFPEVTATISHTLDDAIFSPDAEAELRAQGLLLGGATITQTLAAPAWIPPSEEELRRQSRPITASWDNPPQDIAADIRALTQRYIDEA